MEEARMIEFAATKKDLERMLKVFEDAKNEVGVNSTGDIVMIAQLQIELDKFSD